MLFLDSSEPDEIRALFAWGVLSGVTTNPLILAREGATDLEVRVRDVLAVSHGPVAVELLSNEVPAMLAEAQRYRSWGANRIALKVPFGEAGLQTTRRLIDDGAVVNVTMCMSFPQAYLAALAGAQYVSLFAGRIRDMGYDAWSVVSAVRAQLDREALSSKIIVGSVRQMSDVTDGLSAGAHIVTVPPPLLRKMLHNPKTEETRREFERAWLDRRGGENEGQ